MSDVHLPHQEQRHKPLSFLSGRFDKAQLFRSVLEKEACAFMNTLDRMQGLVATPAGFDLYTDHNNLIFLIDLLPVVDDVSQSSNGNVVRKGVKLSLFNYTCHRVRGEDNVCTDLVIRWFTVPATVRRLVRSPELSSSCTDDFE